MAHGQTDAYKSADRQVDTPVFPGNPFVGLRPFSSDEAILFFGRREQTVELLQQLHRTRFLAVVGSSGCGKSSLIRAGLIPKLQAGFLVEDREQWRIATMKPGDAPLRHLAVALHAAIAADLRAAAPDAQQPDALVESMCLAGASALIEHAAPALTASDANLLLLVDQFEELFRFGLEHGNPAQRDEAADFVSIMLGLTQQQALPIYVVMTMRSDFLGDCDNFYGLPEAMNRSQYLVPRLTRQQRQQAIEGPIRLFGQTLTSRLLDRVLNDVGDQADQLPVMQHALMRTWERWQQSADPALDLPHYEAIGTIKDALSLDADQALAGMDAEARKVTERLFQALTDTDTRNRRIRRPVHLSDVQAITGASREQIVEIIESFCGSGRAFLTLTADHDPLIDISHESLIRQWQTLRQWADKEAESRAMYVRIADDAALYEQGRTGLWRDPALQLALQWRAARRPNQAWAQRYDPGFERAMAFLDKSQKVRDAEAKQKERWRRIVYLAALTVVVVFSYLTWYAWRAKQETVAALKIVQSERQKAQEFVQQAEQQRQEAHRHRQLAVALRLAAQARVTLNDADDGLTRSLLLAVESLKSAWTPEGYAVAAGQIDLLPLSVPFPHHVSVRPTRPGDLAAIAFSPHGRWLATVGLDSVTVQDMEHGTEIALRTDTGMSTHPAVTFSPDNQWLVAGCQHMACVWETASWQMVQQLPHGDGVWSIAFSPDSHWLATASYHSDEVRLYQTGTWKALAPIKPDGPQALAVTFSPDNRWLVVSSMDSLKILEATTRRQVSMLNVAQVWKLAFSPKGDWLVMGRGDGVVELRRVAYPNDGAIQIAMQEEDSIHRMAYNARWGTLVFDASGRYLVGANRQGMARVWDVNTGHERIRIDRQAYAAAFSPDGRFLVTEMNDGTLGRWALDLKAGGSLPHDGTVTRIEFSPDGQWLATAGDNGKARIFDVSTWHPVTGIEPRDSNGHPVQVSAIAFLPDGHRWLTVSSATIRVFEVGNTWQELVAIQPQEPHLRFIKVAFSPDGKWLATWAEPVSLPSEGQWTVNQTVWDVVTGQPVAAAAPGYRWGGSGRARARVLSHDTAEGLTAEAATWQEVRLEGPGNGMPESADGRWRAVIYGNAMRLYETGEDRQVVEIALDQPGTDLAFSADSRWLAMASGNAVRLWPLHADDLIREACKRLPRNLTGKEWAKYLGEQPDYRETCPGLPVPEQ
jgi:WD40 repeat protein/energy-coupling factor transporter ATP-binding protein EcfA2